MNEKSITCPFCQDSDFDLVGLRSHLSKGECAAFDAVEIVRSPFDALNTPASTPEDAPTADATAEAVKVIYAGKYARKIGGEWDNSQCGEIREPEDIGKLVDGYEWADVVLVDPNDIACLERRIATLTAELSEARKDGALIDALETAFRTYAEGQEVMSINGLSISVFADGFHVAADEISEPIIHECDLRAALAAARSAGREGK